jgi:hypothetical protein
VWGGSQALGRFALTPLASSPSIGLLIDKTLGAASFGASRRACSLASVLAALSAMLLGSCGGGSTPGGPTFPQPGGTVAGRYLLEIRPGPSCSSQAGTTLPQGPYSFPMVAAAGGTTPHPGIQILIEGVASSFELEFKYTDFTLRGGLGTTGDGVLTNQGQRAWINAIGTGAVTQKADGIGEVTSGTMIGFVAVGSATAAFNEAAACTALDHTFTLKVR